MAVKSFWWLWFIAAVLACGGTDTPTPPTVAQPSPTPTVLVPSTAVAREQPVTPTPVATATSTPSPTPTAPTPTETSPAVQGPVVRIGGADFPVELAVTAEEQIQGLSGRPTLPADTGMLFIYQQQSRYSFWMPDMHFPLDIVWIGSDCAVTGVTLNALPPEPGQVNEDLPLYRPETPVQYVLEINAGEAEVKVIRQGVGVEFLGELAGKYGC